MTDLPESKTTEITLVQMASVIAIGIGGVLITALQPVLLGALLHDGRLNDVQLGHAATSELISMATVAVIAGAKFKPEKLRLIALLAVLLAIAANMFTMWAAGNAVVAARLVSGCSSGILLWLLVGLIVRATVPERLVGVITTLQSIVALLVAALCGQILIPRYGGSGAFGCLLCLNLLMLLIVWFIPSRYTLLPNVSRSGRGMMPRAAGSLIAVGTTLAGIVSLWVYIPSLLVEIGQSHSIANLALEASLSFQLIGSLTATAVGRKLSYITVLTAATIGGCLIASAMSLAMPSSFYIAAVAILGFVWMVSVAYQVPFVIAADPSRHSAMFVNSAQLFGGAAGPFLASLAVSGDHVRGVLVASASLFGLSFLLVWGVHLRILTIRAAEP